MAKKQMKPTPARDFAAVAKIYGTRDPHRIQLRIMWHYVSLLAETQLTPGNRQDLATHAQHFEIAHRFKALPYNR